MSSADLKANRPLSPHLSIYRFYLTMAISILHRITGVGLYLGTFFVAWWLLAAATGLGSFNFINGLIGSWLGMILLFFYSFALILHGLGGIRYLIMDAGAGLDETTRNGLAFVLPLASAVLTVLLWAIALAL